MKDLKPGTLREALSSETGRQVVAETMPAIRVLAVGGVREHFQTATGPDGKPWKRLAHARPEGGSARPLSDKGLLAASVSARITADTLTLLASHPGANVHQFGAKIRPTRAKALTIPLTAEAKRAGGARRFPRPLFVIRFPGVESGFLAEDDGKRIVFHYVLRREVEIPARPFLGFSKRTTDRVVAILADRYAKRIAQAFGG